MSKDLANFLSTRFRNGPFPKVSQRNVQDRSVLRSIDMVSREHLLSQAGHLSLIIESQKGIKNFLVDQVLGVVEEESSRRVIRGDVFFAEFAESRGIGGEEVFEDQGCLLRVVEMLKFLPSGVIYEYNVSRPFST